MTALGPSDVGDLAQGRHDVIVVGGGIYGAMVHLEAARRGLRSVLVECADFGGATSFNSLRIVHGGLRYIQSLDLRRSLESTRERQWFFERMAPLVQPLPCLVPLYRKGLKRASTMRAGLWLSSLIGAAAARTGGGPDVPRGRVIDPEETLHHFPAATRERLEGAGVWWDLAMPCPARVVIEALRWARQLGGAARNYAAARELLVEGGSVRGVTVHDERTGTVLELRAPVVVNAAGSAVRALAARWDRDVPALFHPTMAWNVLFDRPPLSDHAVALGAAGEGALLFAVPFAGRLAVGTGHARLPEDALESWEAAVDARLDAFIAAVNRCVPQLALARRDVVHVYAGLLPSGHASGETPRGHDVIVDHGILGGPRGLFSVSGVKFTTARAVAARVLRAVQRSGVLAIGSAVPRSYPAVSASASAGIFPADRMPHLGDERWHAVLARLAEEESVVHLDDLLLRRTNLGDDPARAIALAPELCALRPDWTQHAALETARVVAALRYARSSAAAASHDAT